MAAVVPNPIVLNDITLTIDTAGDNYESAVAKAVFTPSVSSVSFTGMSPGAVWTGLSPSTWSLDLTFVQDWSDPDSLGAFLHAHEGEKFPASFDDGSGTVWAATITATPGSVGGSVGQYGTTDVSLGSTKPVPTFV